ncbi:MAG TPA: molybdopterin-dependent oxidoreductase [Acidimicrobiales bacterium]|nr:molybdopterin-dependent oxidoreductase [Acidimicrobiales bacterium]
MTATRRTTFCRLCPAFCGLTVTVDGDRVLEVGGDPDNPVSAGYTCSKGRASGDLHHHPERLDAPLVRDASGLLSPATWPAVLDLVAGTLRRIIDESGPNAVAAYRASGWGLDMAGVLVSDPFFRALGSDQIYSAITIDGPNKVFVPELIAGCTMPWSTPDLAHTDTLLLVGQNPPVSHGHANIVPNPVVAMRTIKQRGRVVVADPRVTESARLADVHVRLRPGSDPAFLAFLVRAAIERGADEPYLAQCADPASVDALARAVAPYTAPHAAELCDVPIDVLEAARDAVLRGTRIGYASGTGASMNKAANITEWLGWGLLAVTGSLDRPGGTIFNPGVLRPREGKPFPPLVDTGARAKTMPNVRAVYGGLPTAAIADEVFAGNIRALFIMGGNPALVFPESAKVRRALEAVELLVVCDIRRTETTELATVVLPVTSQLERADLNTGMFFPEPFIQYTAPVVAPVADRKPTSWVFGELSRRMGVPVMGDAELAAKLPERFTDDDVLEAVAAESRVPWGEVRAAEHGMMVPSAPAPGWLVPDLLPRQLDLAPAPLMAQFAEWSPERGEGLVLINRRLPRQMNSTLRDVGAQAALGPLPNLLVHPDDARRYGLSAGEEVVVESRYGSAPASVEVSDSVRPGAVSIPHGWAAPNVNDLTSSSEELDPLTAMPRYSGFPVTVRPRRG